MIAITLIIVMYLSVAILLTIGAILAILHAWRGFPYAYVYFVPMLVIAAVAYCQAYAWMKLLQ